MSKDTKTCSSSNRSYKRVVQLALFSLMLVLLYLLSRPMLGWLHYVFNDPTEDMGHGWVVPVFSLYLVWRRRRELVDAAASPSWVGVLLSLPLLALLWLGERGEQARLSQVAIYGLIWTMSYACFGIRLARLLLFPVAFLVFTVPLGFLDFFTVRLRLLTAWLSAGFLNGIGVSVARVGTGIHCLAGEGFALDVADPCSGLRSIFALAAITAAYAYLTQRTLWQKWLLFLCSIPLAMVGNMVRIFSIALVAQFFGQEIGTGFYHDYSGYLVFIVGTLLMMQVGSWIGRFGAADPEEAPPPSPRVAEPSHTACWGAWCGVGALLILLSVIYLVLLRMPPPTQEPQAFLARAMPEISGYRLRKPWYCQNEQCRQVFEDLEVNSATGDPGNCPKCGGPLDEVSYGERAYLPSDTMFMKGNYYDSYGQVFNVSVVINGASRMSIHRPELCLPAQGYSIEDVRSRHVPVVGSEPIPIKVVDFRPVQAEWEHNAVGQIYFFVSANHLTASHYVRMLISIRDRALFNRVTRWAMVTIVGNPPFNTPERYEGAVSFLREFHANLYGAHRDTDGVTEMKNQP